MAYLSVISANEMNAASCTTMFKDADDIDAIWKSLKSEGGSSSAGVGISTNFDAKKPKAKMKRKKVFAIQGNDQKFDIDSFSFEESASKSDSIQNNDRDQPQSSIKSCVDILGDLNVTKQFEPVLGDSDDEDDAKENTLILQNSNELFRVERLASALVSSDVKTRVSSLCMLKETMDALLMHCPMPPQLNFSSPYDENKIKLNTNLPLVSDLANSTHSDCDDLHVEPDNKVKNEEMIDFVDTKSQLQAILEACGSPLFRLIGDKHEKCRCLSLECIQSLLLVGLDIGKHIPYLIPAIVARYPPCTYDKDMEVFVQNSQMHDFYKRGGATDRQDRDGLINQNGSFQVIESNEELRLSLCRAFSCIVRGILGRDAGIVLDAYYSEILLALQTSLKDPFPEVKIEVSALLVQLLRVPRWEQAAKYFATGLARTSILNCRHRNTRVVIAAIDLFEASVCVPDKAKVKGSGTSAIADLVGFREENVLPIAAFYDSQSGVSVNTLAELASHKNRRVRLRCCEMLAYFLVCLPDRYDHQQRLLPYILSFASDGNKNIQNTALSCIEKCGLQYEREHPDEIIERRQLGVDGEDTIDYNSGLPNPFTRRPSLGARQYVRANTARFFLAVLGELSSWKEETRKRSLDLLMILVVYCEEHLTKDFQHSINLFAKAIGVQKQAKDGNSSLLTVERFEEVLQLMGKYVDPSVYLPLISPRITGDNSSGTSNAEDGSHSEKTRSIYAFILSSLIKGAPLLRIIPHWLNIASILSNSNCIGPYAGTKIQEEILNAFLSLIVRVGASKKERSIFLSYFADTCNQTKLKSAINESLVNLMNSSDVLGSNSALAKACTESLLKIVSAIDQNAA